MTSDAEDGAGEDIAGLRVDAEQLREAMDSRTGIEQARGVLMALVPCSPEVAWELLVEISQKSDVTLPAVAAALVDTASGGPVPPQVDLVFRQAVAQQRQRGPREAD